MAKGKYETHVLPNLENITMWAQEGATIKTIAKLLRIDYSTFRRYLSEGEKGSAKYQALYTSFAEAAAIADDDVECALHKRATGYDYSEDTMEWKKDPETGEMKLILTKRVTRHVPPDPTSAMFWLTNRRPKKWNYKPVDQEKNEGKTGVIQLAAAVTEPVPTPEVMERLEGQFLEGEKSNGG